jgi:hypothetical protein
MRVTPGAVASGPLLAPNLDDRDWLTLEEAEAHARVEVSEVSFYYLVDSRRARASAASTVRIRSWKHSSNSPIRYRSGSPR